MWQTGYPARSSRKEVKDVTKAAGDAALRSSFWIWIKRDEDAWGTSSEVQVASKKRQGSRKPREVTKPALV